MHILIKKVYNDQVGPCQTEMQNQQDSICFILTLEDILLSLCKYTLFSNLRLFLEFFFLRYIFTRYCTYIVSHTV